ncbi:transcription factor [Pseudomonas viridiflava]|uniref:Transcription factor jumonji domain-containing protein n=1 Tax=Pseudomonas viridiflava TaxID=33069 RepID=A0A3M5P395_PSEVI|nr:MULTISPECIES: cupin-like domain-containing protein [Pseudomonas syringae group]MBA1228908.1 transcription factor [Pseudomonas viridiflava]MCF5709237.1 transcription factor [Pseudomonas syringae]RMT79011.1 Transcription factor jumonji domain-containing protein [Pseudomonas viridiflava]UXB95104.1 cupin-like domain-containing protein [Pseudomonas syringae]UXB95109.1 cupin-like domain-containing protein [Pseudomonas syringae]
MSLTAEMDHPETKFWSLSRFPNYAQAKPVEVIDALSISREDFVRRYVNYNRPCLIKNAVRHWPAFEKWKQSGYIKAHSRNSDVVVRSKIISEVVGWSNPEVRSALIQYSEQVHKDIPFHEFLDSLGVGDHPLVADSCGFKEGEALEQMRHDVGGLPFMPELSTPLHYPPYRSFMYRNSYTDWHFHSADETFMSQVVGAKEVLLLPPDEASWQALRPVVEEAGYLYDIDTQRFPGTRNLRAVRAVVEPGDALYIPVYWWHAVQSMDNAIGATVAATFKTPLHVIGDMRSPIARRLMRNYVFSRQAPLVVCAVLYSMAYRLGRGLAGVFRPKTRQDVNP